MSAVAPSAPSPVAAPSAGSQGEAADPAAFAAEFDSALAQLATGTAAATSDTPTDTPTDAPPALPSDLLVASGPATAGPPLPAPTPAISEMTEIEVPRDGPSPLPALPAAPVSVISQISASGAPTAELVGDAEPTDDSYDADALPVVAAPDGTVLPLPVVPLPPAAVASAEIEAAPAVPAVAPAAATNGTDAPAPALPDVAPAPAPAPPVAAPVAPAAQATAEVADVAPPSRVQVPELAQQISRPLQGLRSFGDGSHTITIRVTPDNLGPVAVHAHVSGENMRIELVAPTDQARAALRDILPDLRRDLSGAGGQASLDLSSGNQPSGRDSAPRDGSANPGRLGGAGAQAPAPGIRAYSNRSDVGLDVLA